MTVPAWMTHQIAAVQACYLRRLAEEPRFAKAEAARLMHNRLDRIFPAQQPGRLLELGCGPGKYMPMLRALGHEVVGVDPCVFETWKLLEPIEGITVRSGVHAEALPFDDASFDYIACLGALLYFTAPAQALDEMQRVLKPGGTLLLRTVNRENDYTARTGRPIDPASSNLYSMEELHALIVAHDFSIVDSWSFGYWPPVLPNFFWYLLSVWVPGLGQEFLSTCVEPRRRINNVVVARKSP
jgi:SAM-dependent methyltransferase